MINFLYFFGGALIGAILWSSLTKAGIMCMREEKKLRDELKSKKN